MSLPRRRFFYGRRHRHPGPIQGHAPGHLRTRLHDWIDRWQYDAFVGDDEDGVSSTDIIWLLGKLWNCTDTIDNLTRATFELGREYFTVGQMVRALKPILVKQIEAGELKPGTCRRW